MSQMRIASSDTIEGKYGNGIDTSPIVKVSAISGDSAATRRDSWDAINKTRNMLSDRSLESVANLTDAQLDADLRRRKVEEHNQAFAQEHSFTRSEQEQNYSQRFTSSVDYDKYGRQSPGGYKGVVRNGGAAAVKVQPVPDGVLGQPVEFESVFLFYVCLFNIDSFLFDS